MRVELTRVVFAVLLSLTALTSAIDRALLAQAQGTPANCDSVVTDPDIKFAEDICSAHVGCALVVKIQHACVAAKSFLKKIGDFFTLSGRQPITSNDVFDAASPSPNPDPRVKRYIGEARAAAQAAITGPAASKLVTVRTSTGPGVWQATTEGNRVASGPGLIFSGTGLLRGNFKDGLLHGPAQVVYTAGNSAGQMTVGTFRGGSLNGPGAFQRADGGAHVGEFAEGRRIGLHTFTFADGRSRIELFDENGNRVASGAIVTPGVTPVAPSVPTELAARLDVFRASRRAAAATPPAASSSTAPPAVTNSTPARPSAGSSDLRPTDVFVESQDELTFTILVGKTLTEALANQIKYARRDAPVPVGTIYSCSGMLGALNPPRKLGVGWWAYISTFDQPSTSQRDRHVWGFACGGATIEEAVEAAYEAAKKKRKGPFYGADVQAGVTADLDFERLKAASRLGEPFGAWATRCGLPNNVVNPDSGKAVAALLMGPRLAKWETPGFTNGNCLPFYNTLQQNQPPPVFGR